MHVCVYMYVCVCNGAMRGRRTKAPQGLPWELDSSEGEGGLVLQGSLVAHGLGIYRPLSRMHFY